MLVYADHLTQHGDPRGELIVVQHALVSRPDDAELLAAEERLLRDRRVSPFSKTSSREVEWRRGFIRSARISDTSGFARLLRHPAGRFLRNLWLEDWSWPRDLIAMLREGPDLPLRQLVLNGQQQDRPIELDLGKFRRLEHLEVEGTILVFDDLALPDLQRLHLRGAFWPPRSARAICAAPLPRVVELEIWFDDRRSSDELQLSTELFARTDLPVRTLRLGRGSREVVRALCDSHLAGKLEELDLYETVTHTGEMDVLVAARDRFGALQRLFVDPRDDATALRAAYGARLNTGRVTRPFATWRP